MNFPKLISVQAIEKYTLSLAYDDGTKGLLNLSDSAGLGVFNYWEESNNFFKAHINPEGGGIAWSEELDICPDAAYLTLKGLSFEEWKEKKVFMPQLSRFYGIIIYMYFKDHNPPHLHAWYGEHKCEINILDLNVLVGSLPNRAFSLVLEWSAIHRKELLENWNLAKEGKPFHTIEPLP